MHLDASHGVSSGPFSWVSYSQMVQVGICGAISSNCYNANKSCVMHIYRQHACCEHSTATGNKITKKRQTPNAIQSAEKSAEYQQALEKNQKRRINSTRERERWRNGHKKSTSICFQCAKFFVLLPTVFFFCVLFLSSSHMHGNASKQIDGHTLFNHQLGSIAHSTLRCAPNHSIAVFFLFLPICRVRTRIFCPFFPHLLVANKIVERVCFLCPSANAQSHAIYRLACIQCTHFPISVFAFPDKCSHRTAKWFS